MAASAEELCSSYAVGRGGLEGLAACCSMYWQVGDCLLSAVTFRSASMAIKINMAQASKEIDAIFLMH